LKDKWRLTREEKSFKAEKAACAKFLWQAEHGK
jgi:hypothetical protein